MEKLKWWYLKEVLGKKYVLRKENTRLVFISQRRFKLSKKKNSLLNN